MDFALVMADTPSLLPDPVSFSASFLVLPDHSAAGGFVGLLKKDPVMGFCRSAGLGGVGLLESPMGRGGAGLNGCATGLVVCPVFSLGEGLKEVGAGRLGLVSTGLGLLVTPTFGCCGFGVLGGSGL